MNFLFKKRFTSPSERRRGNSFTWRANDGEAKALRAFTLIESLVAISVLLVSLAAPLSIAAQSLRSAYYARDQITAFYLAQEAVEYIQAKRDQNYLASASWLNGLSECVTPNSCNVDFPNFTHAQCPSNGCPALYLRTSDQLFVADSAQATPSVFTRTVRITTVTGNTDERAVTVTVSWVSAGISRTFQISEHLFNWL